MRFIGIILLPFTFLYSLAVRLRNHLYNIGYTKSIQFEIPIILTGNLSAGGTGKTPMVEYLIRLLKDNYKLAILSRGYKRTTGGFYLAKGAESFKTLGDEPMQYYRKWNEQITVAVGEDRIDAIPRILFEKPDIQAVLMDDGYQHRALSPDLKILLTDYTKPFFKDYLLPSGRLREPRKEAKRADIVVVTKCPGDIAQNDLASFSENVAKYVNPETPVFYSYIKYSDPEPLFEWVTEQNFDKAIAISGLANPIHFQNYLASKWKIMNAWHYSDHYTYRPSDIINLRKIWEGYSLKKPAILTTEKDATKLIVPEIKTLLEGLPVYVIPIKIAFVNGGKDFDSRIQHAIHAKTGI